MRIVWFSVLLALLCGLLLAGCSGSNNTRGAVRGSMALAVKWPSLPSTTDRYIPRTTQSLVVTIDDNSGVLHMQTVARPADGFTSQLTFPGVLAGTVGITVVAYPEADGTGEPVATASATAIVSNRQTTMLSIDLDSTITQVSIDLYPTDVNASETAQLVATARSADGDIVPVLPQPNGFFWQSSDPAVATVDQHGLLTAVSAGSVTITAMERETGIVGSVDLQINPASGTLVIVIVNDPIGVTITPESIQLTPGSETTFSAVVSGVPNQAVVWSVQEANGGTVTNAGHYTAPATAGTYHVVATCIADPTKFGVAEVVVGGGSSAPAKIVYVRCGAGVNGLWVMNADGTGKQCVFSTTSYCEDPVLSPDGTKIAFQADPPIAGAASPAAARKTRLSFGLGESEGYAMYIVNIDGSGLTLLDDRGYSPVFSPDGTTIAYHRLEETYGFNIYTIRPDGSNKTLLRVNGLQPSYSPDGSEIAFVNVDGLWIMHVDGSNERQVMNANVTSTFAIHPSFSPNGQQLLFHQNNMYLGNVTDGSDAYEICTINTDGTGFTRLTRDQGMQFKAAYSPNGASVVYNQYGSGDEGDIIVMNADGSNKRTIGTGWTPSWGRAAL